MDKEGIKELIPKIGYRTKLINYLTTYGNSDRVPESTSEAILEGVILEDILPTANDEAAHQLDFETENQGEQVVDMHSEGFKTTPTRIDSDVDHSIHQPPPKKTCNTIHFEGDVGYVDVID